MIKLLLISYVCVPIFLCMSPSECWIYVGLSCTTHTQSVSKIKFSLISNETTLFSWQIKANGPEMFGWKFSLQKLFLLHAQNVNEITSTDLKWRNFSFACISLQISFRVLNCVEIWREEKLTSFGMDVSECVATFVGGRTSFGTPACWVFFYANQTTFCIFSRKRIKELPKVWKVESRW